MILEVCVDSYTSMVTAKNAGANRIELCSALNIGGLTPSYGLMKKAKEIEDIEIFVMIRTITALLSCNGSCRGYRYSE